MKVLVIMGTRPEVIKLAPVIRRLRIALEVTVCSTGQHREMLDQALSFFDLQPDVRLDCMAPGQSLNVLSSRLLEGLDGVIETTAPDWVIVQGDTTTAFCGALAAFHRGVKVAHIEAGLRTGNLTSPFPEEANRTLLSRITTRHFAPTAAAKGNLLKEGVPSDSITVTGNTVVDAIEMVRSGWDTMTPTLPPSLIGNNGPKVLVTCHRRENFGGVMLNICGALKRLCLQHRDYSWIFPVHLNPAVREPVMRELGSISNLFLIDPVDYPTSLYLISQSDLVLSDSGGIQEEAPSFGVPTVVMRDHTERREGVDAGFATLAGQNAASIEAAVSQWLANPDRRKALKNRPNPYGDGGASERILRTLQGLSVEEFAI